MASKINPSNIDETYPVPGVNNSTQGLRKNFEAIQANFVAAEEDINDLLSKVVVKADLINGQPTNGINDLNGMVLTNAVFKNVGSSTVMLGTTTAAGTITVDISQGAYQTLTLNANGTTQLIFNNWLAEGTHTELTLRIVVSNTANKLNLPSAANYLFTGSIAEFDLSSKQFTFPITGIYEYTFSTTDAGTNISIISTARSNTIGPINYANAQIRSQQSKNSDVVSILDFVISVKNNVIVTDGNGVQVPIGDGGTHPLSNYFTTLNNARLVYPCALNLTDELAWVALQTALNSVATSGGAVYIPAGNYLFNHVVTMPVIAGGTHGLRLYGVGSGGSIMTFTGATDGIVCNDTQKYHVTIEKLSIITTNASGGSAIKIDAGDGGENAACNVSDIYIDASGLGNWAYNFWGRGYESSMIRNFHAHGGTVGIHLEGYSNATTLINVLLGAQASIGLEVDSAQPVTLFGGTIQGAANVALLKVTNGGKVLVHGAYFENVVACPWIQANGSTLHLFNAHLGGGYSTDAIWGYNWSSIRVEGLTGATNASGSIIRYDSGNFGVSHVHNTVVNSQVSNTYNSGGVTVTDELYVIGTDTNDSNVNDVHWPAYAPYLISISSIKFTDNTSLTYTASTPTTGKYSILDNGKIIFSADDYGKTVKITYTRTAGHGVTFNGVTAPKAMHNLITLLGTGTSHGFVVLRSKAACVDNNYIKMGYPTNTGYAVYTDGVVNGVYTTGSTFTLNNNHFYFLTDTSYICNKPYDSTQGNYDYATGVIPAPYYPSNADVKIPGASQTLGDFMGDNLSVPMFGAINDGTTDTSDAWDAAIASFGSYNGLVRAGRLSAPGAYVISRPLRFKSLGIEITGEGWGSPSSTNPKQGYILWNGPADVPIMSLTECWGLSLRNMRIIGKSDKRANGNVDPIAVSGATNATPIVVSLASLPSTFADWKQMRFANIGGNTSANGVFYVQRVPATNTVKLYTCLGYTLSSLPSGTTSIPLEWGPAGTVIGSGSTVLINGTSYTTTGSVTIGDGTGTTNLGKVTVTLTSGLVSPINNCTPIVIATTGNGSYTSGGTGTMTQRPLAAINCRQYYSTRQDTKILCNKVWLGEAFDDDQEDGHFTYGVLIDGTNANNDFGTWDTVTITRAVEAGFYFGGTQNTHHQIRNSFVYRGKYGVISGAGTLKWDGGSIDWTTAAMVKLYDSAQIEMIGLAAENNVMQAQLRGQMCNFIYRDGYFQLSPQTAAIIIENNGDSGERAVSVRLDNVVYDSQGYTYSRPTFDFRHNTALRCHFDITNCRGIAPSDFYISSISYPYPYDTWTAQSAGAIYFNGAASLGATSISLKGIDLSSVYFGNTTNGRIRPGDVLYVDNQIITVTSSGSGDGTYLPALDGTVTINCTALAANVSDKTFIKAIAQKDACIGDFRFVSKGDYIERFGFGREVYLRLGYGQVNNTGFRPNGLETSR